MSSYLCYICHNTIKSYTSEGIREKYREILCPDSHLCHICCHMLNKLWSFKYVCLKRSLEYPALFSEKETINLQRNDIERCILCPENDCLHLNSNQYYYRYADNDNSINSNEYVKLEDDRNIDDLEDYLVDNITTENNDLGETELNLTDVAGQFDDDCFNDTAERSYNDFEFETESYDDVVNDSQKKDDEICNKEESAEDIAQKKKSTKKKRKKRSFVKILLSTEEQKASLEAQRKTKKYIEAEFKCYNCALSFLFKDTYQTHMMRHEESNGEYRCTTCTLRFATPAVLRAHIALHTERYRCTKCDKLLRVRQRQTHARRCHRKETDEASCHLCGNVFKDASGLQQHLKRFHLSKNSHRVYPCSVCGKTYSNQAAVRTHMITHIHRKFACDKCESTFSSPYTLNQHKKKHSQDTDTQHYCTTCGIGYSSRKSLLAHNRNALNHQQRSFECPVCGRVCPNERALTSHISTVHSASKDYACSYCPARYTSRKSLVRHIGNHSQKLQPKMATCHLCGNHFKGNSKLNRHLREVCEKEKLEEVLSSYYDQQGAM